MDLGVLFDETVERNYRGGSNTIAAVLSQESCRAVWGTFTNWSQRQVDAGHCIYIKGFGIVGYEPSKEGIRILNVKLLDNFLGAHHLALEPAEHERMANNVIFEP